jgi:hypothetical protein
MIINHLLFSVDFLGKSKGLISSAFQYIVTFIFATKNQRSKVKR